MAQEGLLLRVAHTGKAAGSIHLSDITDGVDVLTSFRKAGAIYVPHPSNGGESVLIYTGSVAISHGSGAIRKFVDAGYLTVEFVAGAGFAALLPSVLDEGALLSTTPTTINFVGAGVTATSVADAITVTIPGGGGSDHATLSSLGWAVSGHTGTASSVAGFDGAGATRTYLVGSDLQGWDADLDALSALATLGMVARTGAGTYGTWTLLGTAGNIVITNGDGVSGAPTFNVGPNVITTSTVLTGDVSGTLPGLLSVVDLTIAGEAQGSLLYFNGTNWVSLTPSTVGLVLTTQGVGANPEWSSAGSSSLLWGASTVGTTTTTRYLAPGSDVGLAETVSNQFRVVRGGTIRSLYVRHNTPAGNGLPIVYTLRVNNVATTLTVSLASTGSDVSDLVHSVVVAAGDLLDFEVTKAAVVETSPTNVVAMVEFV